MSKVRRSQKKKKKSKFGGSLTRSGVRVRGLGLVWTSAPTRSDRDQHQTRSRTRHRNLTRLVSHVLLTSLLTQLSPAEKHTTTRSSVGLARTKKKKKKTAESRYVFAHRIRIHTRSVIGGKESAATPNSACCWWARACDQTCRAAVRDMVRICHKTVIASLLTISSNAPLSYRLQCSTDHYSANRKARRKLPPKSHQN